MFLCFLLLTPDAHIADWLLLITFHKLSVPLEPIEPQEAAGPCVGWGTVDV
jgi:hypothetical protein